MKISVCISTRNRATALTRCLASLAAQHVKPYEVVVVDNNSRDNTRDVVSSFVSRLPLRYVHERRVGLPYGRNSSIRHARGSILAFLDDDCVADRLWIARMKEHFSQHPHSRGVIGITTPLDAGIASLVEDAYVYRQYLRYLSLPDKKQKITSGNMIDFKNAAFRSDFIKKYRFSTSVPFGDVGNEDAELGRRMCGAGIPIYFDPKIRVSHEYSQTIARMLQRNFWSGYCDYMLYELQGIDLKHAPRRASLGVWAKYIQMRMRPLGGMHKLTFGIWLLVYPIASNAGRTWAAVETKMGMRHGVPMRY